MNACIEDGMRFEQRNEVESRVRFGKRGSPYINKL